MNGAIDHYMPLYAHIIITFAGQFDDRSGTTYPDYIFACIKKQIDVLILNYFVQGFSGKINFYLPLKFIIEL